MSPVVMYFASGESLYAGSALLLLAIALSPLLRRGWQRLRNIAAWLGLLMMVMASPPFGWIVDIGFLGAFMLWLGAEHRIARAAVPATWRTATAAILAGVLLALSATELRHRYPPTITGVPSDHLVVIGDSISAGIDPRVQSWSTVMQQMTGVPVKNLALPGADLLEALTTVAKLTPDDRVLLLETGGNDLLSGVPSGEFARRLQAVLERVTSPDRVVVMFELPLLPHWTSYGQAQRRLASNYGVFLIPKRDFAAVISGRNATLDGLHLSDLGAHRMANLVARILSPVLKSA